MLNTTNLFNNPPPPPPVGGRRTTFPPQTPQNQNTPLQCNPYNQPSQLKTMGVAQNASTTTL